MCGRFTQHYTWEEVHAFLSVFGPPRNLQPHYNIAPTDTVDVIRLTSRPRAGADALGPGSRLVEEDAKELPATFNARAESVADKPMFRDAFKPPLHHSGKRLLRMDRREGREAAASIHRSRRLARSRPSPGYGTAGAIRERRWILSCTIIVCGASDWMERYHDRMPVILEPKDFDGWLRGVRSVPERSSMRRKIRLAFLDGIAAAQSHRRR